MDPVSANEEVTFRGGSVFKLRNNYVSLIDDIDTPAPEVQLVTRKLLAENIEKIGSMDMIVWCPIRRSDRLPQFLTCKHTSIVPSAGLYSSRHDRRRFKIPCQTVALQQATCIG
jgi:hypothetical protein